MEATTIQHKQGKAQAEPRVPATAVIFTPLDRETRTHVDTGTMCWHLGFAHQTARLWACKETYPAGLRPIRVNGRLKWPVAGIRKTLGVV
jgi:hypothetical protein